MLTETQLSAIMAYFVEFCIAVTGKVPRPYQLEPARAIIQSAIERQGRTIVVLMSRQAGKNEMMIQVSLFLASNFPGIKIGSYSPTFPQAEDITMRRLRAYLRNDVFKGRFNINRGRLVEFALPPDAQGPFADRKEGSLFGCFSAERTAKKEGHTWDIIWYNESVAGHVRILTDQGSIPISDIVHGKLNVNVLGYDFDREQWVWQPILDYHEHRSPNSTVQVEYEYEDILSQFECTADHRIWTVERGYVPAIEVKEGEHIAYVDISAEATGIRGTLGRQVARVARVTVDAPYDEPVYDLTTHTHNFVADGILVHNCQDIERDVIDAEISPMGAATNATEVYEGHPFCVDSKLFDVIRQIEQGTIDGDIFIYPYQVIERYLPEYAAFVAKKKAELHEDSTAFRTMYALEWVEGLGMFFPMERLRKGRDYKREWLGREEAGRMYCAGIDVAGDRTSGKRDYTVILILEVDPETQVKTVVDIFAWQGLDWEKQFEETVFVFTDLYPHAGPIMVDATGVGAAFGARLERALGENRVVRVNIT